MIFEYELSSLLICNIKILSIISISILYGPKLSASLVENEFSLIRS